MILLLTAVPDELVNCPSFPLEREPASELIPIGKSVRLSVGSGCRV